MSLKTLLFIAIAVAIFSSVLRHVPFVIIATNVQSVAIATKIFPRKEEIVFVAIAMHKCCNSNEIPWEKCPHVLVCAFRKQISPKDLHEHTKHSLLVEDEKGEQLESDMHSHPSFDE